MWGQDSLGFESKLWTAKIDALVESGCFLIGPLAKHIIDLMAACELVADAEPEACEI